ncbi:RT0821/Lpp0805 family surface protein, partial [Magnetococcales bacterium HHB-1]
ITATLIALTLLLSGCVSTPENKAQSGAGLGALTGALAGSLLGNDKNKEQNALIGAAVGGLVGYLVGNEMDKMDQAQLANTLENTPSQQTRAWTNPDTGNQFYVTPGSAEMIDGKPCRTTRIEMISNERTREETKRACREADGEWQFL